MCLCATKTGCACLAVKNKSNYNNNYKYSTQPTLWYACHICKCLLLLLFSLSNPEKNLKIYGAVTVRFCMNYGFDMIFCGGK